MKKPVLIVVVLLAVLAASAALFWRKDSADAGNGSGSATAGADASPAGQAPGVQAPLPARIADQPLPPVETPLRETLADLQRRADRGEAGAACRLASHHVASNDKPQASSTSSIHSRPCPGRCGTIR